jgi:hypothetical protein
MKMDTPSLAYRGEFKFLSLESSNVFSSAVFN